MPACRYGGRVRGARRGSEGSALPRRSRRGFAFSIFRASGRPHRSAGLLGVASMVTIIRSRGVVISDSPPEAGRGPGRRPQRAVVPAGLVAPPPYGAGSRAPRSSPVSTPSVTTMATLGSMVRTPDCPGATRTGVSWATPPRRPCSVRRRHADLGQGVSGRSSVTIERSQMTSAAAVAEPWYT